MIVLFNKLRARFLKPDSRLELRLRTIYHKIAATRMFFHLQDRLARRSYQRCRKERAGNLLVDVDAFNHKPKVSFLLQWEDQKRREGLSTIKSLQALRGNHWELNLSAPSGSDLLNNPEVFQNDTRITVVEGDVSELLDWIKGEYALFCHPGDRFFEDLLFHFYQVLSENPEAYVIYYDCEYANADRKTYGPFFKPAAASPALLLSVNYLSRALIKKSLLEKALADVELINGLKALDYRIGLWLCENAGGQHHIPQVLVSQADLPTPVDPAVQQAIISHLSCNGLSDVAAERKPEGVRFIWNPGSPTVAIIIPSRNNRHLLEPLLTSMTNRTDLARVSIHIVDNGSEDPATLAYYESIQRERNIKIISYRQPFNYSQAINLGVAESHSDLVLLLNDDMAVEDPDWLPELEQWAVRPESGVVGAKLLRPNRTIQHAGIIMGLSGFMGHLYLNAPEHYHGLAGSVDWHRNYLALTGACQMMRREVFNEVGGYDEGYRLAFGDIDFCIRVHERGYQNVYSPYARLIHFEGRSRGYTTPVADVLRGYERLAKYLVEEDPYFSPNLTYTRIPKCVKGRRTRTARREQIETRRRFYTS